MINLTNIAAAFLLVLLSLGFNSNAYVGGDKDKESKKSKKECCSTKKDNATCCSSKGDKADNKGKSEKECAKDKKSCCSSKNKVESTDENKAESTK